MRREKSDLRANLLEGLGRAREAIARHGKLSAVIAVASATIVFVPLRDHLGREQWGWPYLLVVGAIAGTAGIVPALIASVLAFFAWNFFFFPPYYTLFVAQRGDLVHLVAFLVVAVAVGWQTGRLREREEAATREERHVSALSRISARLVSEDSEESMARAVSEELGTILGGALTVVWVRDGSGALTPLRMPESAAEPSRLRRYAHATHDEAGACFAQGDLPRPTHDVLAAGGGRPIPVEGLETANVVGYALCAGGEIEGVLQVLLPDGATPDAHDSATLASAANLVAAFLHTRRLSGVAMHAAAEREAERLRAALISSVSHELKTPLASVTAAITDLMDPEVQRTPVQYVENLGGIAEDLDRLDGAIADLLDVSRLEAQAWQPRPASHDLGEVLGSVLSRLPRAARERIDLDVPDDLPTVYVDSIQAARAIGHVLDNALEYSADSVRVSGAASAASVLVSIEDRGPGIPAEDLPHVFDKFFRGRSGKASRSSTGLGLAITKEIVSANAGEITIEKAIPHGTRFIIAFPTKE